MATQLRLLCLSLALTTTLSALAQPTPTAETILHQLSQKLSSLSTISYHYRRELNYASENYHNVLDTDIYFDFDPTQQPADFLYQAHRPEGFEIFNGSEIVRATTATHTLQMSAVHSAQALENVSFLFNSIVTLRAALPTLLNDNSITKSLVSCTASTCVVDLRLPQTTLSALGTRSPIQLKRDITYRITLDRATTLPTEIKQLNSANSDFMDTQFSNLHLNPPKPAPSSWLYTSYPDYKLVLPANAPKPLAVGSTAPSWSLPLLNKHSETISLDEVLKQPDTKLVLLEFWISHCGYSIDAVSTLNNIDQRYAASGLKIYAANPDDSPATAELFRKNFKPTYPLLTDASTAAQHYGVSAYPTIFLINREGKIIYAGAADDPNLQNTIKNSL